MCYNKGDKVRVRDDLQAGKTYGATSVSQTMEKLKGQMVTISQVHETLSGNFVYRVEGNGGYWWTYEMFEELVYTLESLFEELVHGVIDEATYKKMLKKVK